MKTDARVRYTREIIKKTYIELLKEKPIRSITVKEICERAQINRTTFYKHFSDSYAVFEQLENDAVDGMVDLIDRYEGDSQQILMIILKEIQDWQAEIQNLLRQEEAADLLYRLAVRSFKKINEKKATSLSAMEYGYFAGGVGGLISYWVVNGMKETPEEIAQAIMRMSKSIWNSQTPDTNIWRS